MTPRAWLWLLAACGSDVAPTLESPLPIWRTRDSCIVGAVCDRRELMLSDNVYDLRVWHSDGRNTTTWCEVGIVRPAPRFAVLWHDDRATMAGDVRDVTPTSMTYVGRKWTLVSSYELECP